MTDRKHPKMTKARTRFSARYLVALRNHLSRKTPANGDHAQGLGRAALAAGLAPLDLAVMHEKAVLVLASSHNFDKMRNGWLKRKGAFFTQALIPLEAAQQSTRGEQ